MELKERTFFSVMKEIDGHVDLVTIPEKEKKEWERTIKKQILYLEDSNGDKEDMAVAYLYLLLYRIKSNRENSSENIEHTYHRIKKLFLEEEKEFHGKIKVAEKHRDKKILVNQLLYFYKIVEFYLTYLEKTLLFHSFSDIAQKVYHDKIHFLQKHQLLEKNIKKFFAYLHLSFKLTLKKFIFVYAFLGGIAIVLFWHGVWGITDWIIAQFEYGDHLFPYVITTIIGSGILFILGIFLDQTVGERTNASTFEEIQTRDLDELKMLEKVVRNKVKK